MELNKSDQFKEDFPLNRIIALLALLLIAAGCESRAAPAPIVTPPDPITMTARELYLGYDGSSRVIPAEYSAWDGMVWVSGGYPVSSGVTYVLPVPTIEGVPNAEIVRATSGLDGEWLLGQDKTTITLVEDTTYQLSKIKFWQLRIAVNQLFSDQSILHLHWQVKDVTGKLVAFHQYYRLVQ